MASNIPAPGKAARVQWTEEETWALKKLREDNLPALRRQKRNPNAYEAIRE